LLIEQYQVKRPLTTEIDGIGAITHGGRLIAFLFEKCDVGTEKLNLVIDPK
jgi:hypothetical protein